MRQAAALTGQGPGQREEGRIVGHVARGEEQRARLLVEVGQLSLQLLVEQRVTGDVASATGAGPVLLQRLATAEAEARSQDRQSLTVRDTLHDTTRSESRWSIGSAIQRFRVRIPVMPHLSGYRMIEIIDC